MALAVVISPNGIPVSSAPSPYGFPVIVASNGFGVPVTPVASGGRSVFDVGGTLFGPATIPVNTGVPAITGSPLVGNTLLTSSGTWSGSAATYTYQWKRGGANIAGATSSSYLLVPADLGTTITVTVTATNTAGNASATSAGVGPVASGTPANTVLPVISGSLVVGSLLTASNGTWTGTGTITYTYQWKRGGSAISGATANAYTSVTADIGATITIDVTATNTAGNATATAAGVGPITSGGVGPTAPILTITSPSTDNTPEFTIEVDNTVAAGDSIRLQVATAGTSFASPISDTNHTITAPEDAANSISLSLTALADANYEARCSVTDAGVTSAWSNVVPFLIGAADSTPNAFTFTDVTGAALSTVVVSNTITVAGINVAAALTITGGEYSINGGAYASTSTTVVVGNTVTVRGTSSGSASTAVNVVLTIGGVSDTFTITTAAGGAEDAATTAWVANVVAAGGTVGTTRRGVVDTFIKALKAAGLWTTLDRYWLLAGENNQSARVDLKVGTIITPVNSWAFTANTGYAGNGSSSYGDTGVDVSTLGGQYTQNSATAGCQVQTNRTTGTTDIYAYGAANGSFTAAIAFVPLDSAGSDQNGRLNEVVGGSYGTGIASSRGSFIQTRETSAGSTLYKNGAAVGTPRTATSAGLPTGNIYINALQFGGSPFGPSYSTDTISCFFFGGKWTAAQVSSFHTAQNAMMSSIGIGMP